MPDHDDSNARTGADPRRHPREIGELKAELAALREEHRLFTEGLRDGVYHLDLDGRFTYVNDVMLRRSGHTRQSLLGQPCYEMILPKDKGRVRAKIEAVMRGEAVPPFVFPYETASGKLVYVEVNMAPVVEAGQVTGAVGVSRDVTARKAAEVALRTSERRYRALVAASPDAVIVTDLDGVITDVSERAVELSGFDVVDDLVGRDVYELFAPEQHDAARTQFDRVEDGGGPAHDIELTFVRPDGSRFLAEVNAALMADAEGTPMAIVGTVRDITKRRQADEALRRRADFENVVSQISQRFVNVSADDLDECIRQALESIGRFTGVDHCYVFMFSDDRTTVGNTHDWCVEGLDLSFDELRARRPADHSWTLDRLAQGEVLCVPRMADMPAEATAERDKLLARGLQAFLVVPLMNRGTLLGGLGLSFHRAGGTWPSEDIALLKTVADTLVHALERKQAREALVASEANYRAIFNSANDGIFVHDIHTGEMLDVNAQVTAMYGYTPDELRGRAAGSLGTGRPPYTPDDAFELMHRAVAGEPQLFEWNSRHKNGTEFWTEINLKQAIIGGQPRLLAVVRNITERKQAEQTLRDSEERFRQFTEHVDEVFWLTDAATGAVLYVNPAYEEIWGRTCQSLYERPLSYLEIVHPDDRPHVEATVAATERGVYAEVDYRIVRSDESLRWIHSRLFPVTDDTGAPRWRAGIAEDITDRKLDEEALRREHELMNRVMDTSPVGITVVNADGHIVFANAAAERVLRLNSRSIAQRDFNSPDWSITDFDGNPVPDDQLPFRRIMATDKPVHDVRHAITGPDGERVLLSINAAPLHGETGQLEGMVAAVSDITAQVKAEKALRESEERYRNVYTTAPLAFVVWDSECRVLDWNDHAERLFGWTRDEVVGHCFFDFILPEHEKAGVEAVVGRFMLGDLPSRHVNDNLTKSGDVITCEWANSPLRDADGRVVGGMSLGLDVTERIRAEHALRESEQRYRAIVNHQTELICRTTVDFKITFVNEAYCRTFGKTPEELVGHSFLPLIPETYRQDVKDYFTRLNADNPVGTHEHQVIAPNGALRWQQWTNQAICDEHGHIIEFQAVGRDITDQRRAENALRKSEERFRGLFENAVLGLYRTTPDGRILLANPALVRMLGHDSFEELATRNVEVDIYEPGHSRAEFKQRIERDGLVIGLEAAWTRRDGTALYVRETGRAIRDEHGNTLYYEGTVEDITKRKHAEVALRESQRRLATLMSNLPGMAYRCRNDSQWTMEFVSEGCAALTGYLPDDLLGNRTVAYVDLIHREDRQLVWNGIQTALQQHQPFRLTYRIIAADGTEKWVWEQGQGVRTDDGTIVALEGFIADITETKHAEEAQRLADLQYRTTLDSMADAIHVVGPDLRIQLVNAACTQWVRDLGITTDLIGSTIFEAFPFLPATVRDEYHQVFHSGQPLVTEEASVVNNTQIITETRKIPIFEGDTVVRVVTVIRDISEQSKTEAELLRAEKLESLGVLAGGIAHDFSNLLTGIIANLTFAANRLPAAPRAAEALDDAERAALRAKALTQQLLTFSRGGTPVKKTMDLGPLIRETAEFALSGSNVRSNYIIADDLAPIQADAAQISQVIQNIVINADQAMPKGGIVDIHARNETEPGPAIATRAAPDRPRVLITIRDSGTGIPKEHHRKIFDPYFTTKATGSGLGLAVSYSVVKNHGGDITVDSVPGVGSAFHISLPASQRPAPAAPRTPDAKTLHGSGKVLIMDDERVIRKATQWLLTDIGYTVESAEDGAQALDLYRNAMADGTPFDAVVLDLTVPGGMGGKECIAKLLELDPNVRAIVCSGYASEPIIA